MTEPTLKIGTTGYKLNPEKLKGAPQSVLPYILGCFYFKEEYEYFDVIKDYLDIPEPKKSLEEISQELDEKFEKLIEQTKRNFNASKLTGERNYEWNFDKIIGNFEYARENGNFPIKYTFTTGVLDGSYLVSDGSCGVKFSSPSFVVKHGSNHQGYYTIGDDGYYRFYVEKKPNVVFRWFVYKLMGFQWIDEVLK
jgi:hypothetical protein